jgi:hypothetical protein
MDGGARVAELRLISTTSLRASSPDPAGVRERAIHRRGQIPA